MPYTPDTRIDLQEVNARYQDAHRIIAGFSLVIPVLADLWRQVDDSLSDIPVLASEITRSYDHLTVTRLDRANLAAAGMATIAAHRNGEPDPLAYLLDELNAQGYDATGTAA